MSTETTLTKLQLKVVFALCDDMKPPQIMSKLNIPEQKYRKNIDELKEIYGVETNHGIVYQHFIRNQERYSVGDLVQGAKDDLKRN